MFIMIIEKSASVCVCIFKGYIGILPFLFVDWLYVRWTRYIQVLHGRGEYRMVHNGQEILVWPYIEFIISPAYFYSVQSALARIIFRINLIRRRRKNVSALQYCIWRKKKLNFSALQRLIYREKKTKFQCTPMFNLKKKKTKFQFTPMFNL